MDVPHHQPPRLVQMQQAKLLTPEVAEAEAGPTRRKICGKSRLLFPYHVVEIRDQCWSGFVALGIVTNWASACFPSLSSLKRMNY
jgi:hypothetical protein